MDWWEKAALAAVDEGVDPPEAIGLFQRSETLAGILKAAFRLAVESQGQSVTSRPSFWAAHRSTRSALSAHSAWSSSSGHVQGCVPPTREPVQASLVLHDSSLAHCLLIQSIAE